MRVLASLAAIGLLTGCAVTSDEQPIVYTFNYDLAEPKEVLQAYENVFRLADGEDVTFIRPASSHGHNQLQVNHSWLLTTLVTWHWGTDTYALTAVPMPPVGTSLTVSGVRNSRTLTNTWQKPRNSAALYDMLDARARYFLGEVEDWRSCHKQGMLEPSGTLDPLCSFTSDDMEPPL